MSLARLNPLERDGFMARVQRILGLKPLECDMLSCLLAAPGQVVGNAALDECRSEHFDRRDGERAVALRVCVRIGYVRRALEDVGLSNAIRNEASTGYALSPAAAEKLVGFILSDGAREAA